MPRRYGDVSTGSRETSYLPGACIPRDVRGVDYIRVRHWDSRQQSARAHRREHGQSSRPGGRGTLQPKITRGARRRAEPGADASSNLRRTRGRLSELGRRAPADHADGALLDVVNFAPRITAAAVVTLGFIDTIAPPVGIWTASTR